MEALVLEKELLGLVSGNASLILVIRLVVAYLGFYEQCSPVVESGETQREGSA
jgi:hypothetical protein